MTPTVLRIGKVHPAVAFEISAGTFGADYFVQLGGASAHITVARDGTWRDPSPFVDRTMKVLASKLAAARLPAALSFELDHA